MRRKPPAISGDDAAIRFAWWAAFFATLTLVAVLGLAKSAQALTASPPGGGKVLAPMASWDEDDGEEAEASEDEGFEDENCGVEEDEECEDEGGSAEAPEECLLSTAQPTVLASANKDTVRLQVRYTTSAPTTVAVAFGLHGSKGSLYLGDDKQHFGKQGVLRLSRHLSEAQMAKVMAAKGFTVRLRAPAAPGYCKEFFDYQLDVKRATPSGLSWQQAAE